MGWASSVLIITGPFTNGASGLHGPREAAGEHCVCKLQPGLAQALSRLHYQSGAGDD